MQEDEDGGVIVEAAIVIPMMIVFLFGAVDFLFAMNQWNAASKAAQLGARLAAVSSPVATGLVDPATGITQQVLSSTVLPGGTMPSFTVTCSGNNTTCSCNSSPSGCYGYGSSVTLDTNALKTIVYGRGNNGSCNSPSSFYFAGMCDMYPGLQPANVVVTYTQTGLGYAGRPDGPVPTVQVSLRALNFRFFFLSSLLGFSSIPIPIIASAPTTMTGEALCSSAQTFTGPSTAC
jgi:Flp pilus assembly protein TadG